MWKLLISESATPALLKSPTSLFPRRSQRRLHILVSLKFENKKRNATQQKKSDIYRSFIGKKMTCFSRTVSETDFEETTVYREKYRSRLLRKRRTSLDESRQKASRTFEKSGPVSHVPRVKHTCEGAETSIFRPIEFQFFPGPAHDIRSEALEIPALYGPARHLCGSARGKGRAMCYPVLI